MKEPDTYRNGDIRCGSSITLPTLNSNNKRNSLGISRS